MGLTKRHIQYFPLLILIAAHIYSFYGGRAFGFELRELVNSIVISYSFTSWLFADFILFLACLYPLYEKHQYGKYLFFCIGVYCLANVEFILFYRIYAWFFDLNHTGSFSLVSPLALIMFAYGLKKVALEQKEWILVNLALLVSSALAGYVLAHQVKVFQ